MVVRLSALCAGHPLSPGIFLLLISLRGWIDPRAIVQLEGQLKNSVTSLGIKPATYRLVLKCRIKDEWLMNLEGFGEKWQWPNWGTIPAFDWRKLWRTWDMIASVLAEIRTEHLLNVSAEHYHCTNLLWPGVYYIVQKFISVNKFSEFLFY
jgi:hypothetical protein